jgi:hypothetical protein
MACQGLELIPERLGFDAEPFARHHAYLAFEREMIRVLRHGDAHRERRTVATTRNDGRRRRCRHHRAVAGAAVLLPHVVFDVIGRFDGRNSLGGFGLIRQLGERPAARGAGALVLRQLMPDLHDG